MSKVFQARGTFLAVRPMDPVEVLASGIIIPKTVQKEEPLGVVLSIGDQVTIDVRPGDTVVLIPYAGTTIRVRPTPDTPDEDAPPILIIPQTDIQGFVFDTSDPAQAARAKAAYVLPELKPTSARARERVKA